MASQQPVPVSPLPAAALRMRRHREAMELALCEGLTLDEARSRVETMAEHRARLEADDRLQPEPAERPTMWWQRD